MAEKIVICCRMSAAGARGYLIRTRALTQRAEALGATLVAWGALSLSFAWDPDAIEEAIHLAVTADEDTPEGGESWVCGVAQGEMEALALTGYRAELAWGEPLVIAVTLARIARHGEVLLHASVKAALEGLLNTKEARVASDSGIEVIGVPLDTEKPWKRGKGGRVPSSRSMLAVSPPAPMVITAPEAPAPAPPPAAEASPPVPEEAPVEPGARLHSLVDFEEIAATDPEAFAARLTQLTREALLGGDAQSLERWSAGLKATGEKEQLAERMHAIARLSKGKIGDALRSLKQARREAEAGGTLAKRCQAALSFGVGLSFAGRFDEALLEGLDALARAREGGDEKAVRACLAFLAKLFSRVDRAGDAAAFRSALRAPPP